MNFKDIFNADNNELEKVTKELKINNQIIELRDRIIQLNHVESVSIVEPPHRKINSNVMLLFLAGILLLFFNAIIALIILAFCGYYFYSVVDENNNLGKNVYINLSSGYYVVINFKNLAIARQTVDVLKDYLNGHNKNITLINVENSNITIGDDSPIIEESKE